MIWNDLGSPPVAPVFAAALDAAVLTCSAANMWMRCSDWDSDWILDVDRCGCCGRCLEAQISQGIYPLVI